MHERTRPYPSENRKLKEKQCRDCGKVLPIAEFDWNGRGDWLPRCRKCHRANVRRYTAGKKGFLNDIKEGYGCQCGCGESVGAALLFHHRDPSTKLSAVSSLATASMERLLAEIAKCDVLCFNCHAKAHAGLIPFPPAPTEERGI